MIYESHHWKEPLLKTATWLKRVRLSDRTTEKTYVRIEREVFISFYAVRKLLDTVKISDWVKGLTTEVEWHPNLRAVHHMNWEHIDLLYDLERTFKETRDVRFLCNQFIHSFVFVPFEENERIGGFLVSSDKEKNKKLYRVTLDQVVSLFRVVGRNYPSDGFFRYDHDTGQFLYGVR